MKPVLYTTAALFAFSLPVFADAPAGDAQVCMDSAELEAALIDWYGEAPVPGQAEANRKLWAAGIGGTWTVISYGANGQGCVVGQGDDFTPSDMSDELVAALEGPRSIEVSG